MKKTRKLETRGTKPLMNDLLMDRIKQLFFEGKNLTQIAENLEISERTLRRYKNNNENNLAENLANWKRLQTLEKAEQNLKEIAEIKIDKKNTPLLKIVADKSQYLTETLGKAYYSKSIEHTGTIKHEQTLLTDEQKDIMLELLQEQKRLKDSNVIEGEIIESNE